MARFFSGQLTRDRRLAAGLRVEQVALHVHRSAYSINEYEQGRVTPSTPVLLALADLYGCPVDAFIVEVAESAA